MILHLFFLLFTIPEHSFAKEMKKEIRISITEFCPLMCPGEKKPGYVIDITKTIFKMYNRKVTFITLPWARAVHDVTRGETDGILAAAKAEAPEAFYPSEAIAVQGDCFYGSKKDPWRPISLSSFKNKTTIVFKGWSFEKEYLEKLGLVEYKKQFTNFSFDKNYLTRSCAMVNNKRVNSFWMIPDVVAKARKDGKAKNCKNIRKLGCLNIRNLYLGLNPTAPEFSKIISQEFAQGVRKLRKSGQLSTILNKYGIKDWQ